MALFESKGGEVRRGERGQAKMGEPIFPRLHPPIAELTPEDLTGVYCRGVIAALSSVTSGPVANVRG